MTLEFDLGDVWFESFTFTLVVPAGAGSTNSAVQNLTKPGRFITGGWVGRNATVATAAEASGLIGILNQVGAVLNRGDPITGVILNIRKVADAAGGTINVFGWVLVKK